MEVGRSEQSYLGFSERIGESNSQRQFEQEIILKGWLTGSKADSCLGLVHYLEWS